jgi:hypothetical protein
MDITLTSSSYYSLDDSKPGMLPLKMQSSQGCHINMWLSPLKVGSPRTLFVTGMKIERDILIHEGKNSIEHFADPKPAIAKGT